MSNKKLLVIHDFLTAQFKLGTLVDHLQHRTMAHPTKKYCAVEPSSIFVQANKGILRLSTKERLSRPITTAPEILFQGLKSFLKKYL